MLDFFIKQLNRLPIRVRLTLWYVLLMAITFTVAGGYLLLRFQNSLTNSVDSALQIAASQSITAIEDDEENLPFQQDDISDTIPQNPNLNFALRVLAPDGTVIDTRGQTENISNWGPREPGYITQSSPGEDQQWRIYSQPILAPDQTPSGWIQVAQSLDTVADTLQDFRDQLLLVIPFVLLLAGVGGYFLAGRALRPIDRITRTAAEIEANDLSRRLAYQGPSDEIGRLAQTFDHMLDRLKTAFERERGFTADAAHELRTPLTVLKGQIEVTLSQSRSEDDYIKTFQDLASQVDRLIRLSNALLFLSRSDQNQLSWEPNHINLGELLTVVIEQMQPLAEEYRLTLNSEISPEIPFTGDKDHLIRLFLNLLDNAVKYTPAGGEVKLQTNVNKAEIHVLVHNDGPGIPEEHIRFIFDRFHRVDSDRSSETGGSGLGLAIAQEIARMHGGYIRVQSELGQGTTFIVQLPQQ
jgi:heavy metal sensor kinase